jgi:hypothetical protein
MVLLGVILMDLWCCERTMCFLCWCCACQMRAVLAGAGAKLTREVFFNLWKYSSLFPGNGARKTAGG